MSKEAILNTVLFLFFVVVVVIAFTCLQIRHDDMTDVIDGNTVVGGEVYEVVR